MKAILMVLGFFVAWSSAVVSASDVVMTKCEKYPAYDDVRFFLTLVKTSESPERYAVDVTSSQAEAEGWGPEVFGERLAVSQITRDTSGWSIKGDRIVRSFEIRPYDESSDRGEATFRITEGAAFKLESKPLPAPEFASDLTTLFWSLKCTPALPR